jgi:hypothetical protein
MSIAALVPTLLILLVVPLTIFLLRIHISHWMNRIMRLRAQARNATLPAPLRADPALTFTGTLLAPTRLLLHATPGTTLASALISLTSSPIIALLLFPALLTLMVAVLIIVAHGRYVTTLERELTPAIGRFSALLRSGNSLRPSLIKLLAEMPPGPIRVEWSFIVDRIGTPLINQEGIATPAQVVEALSVQTPSRRHATFLGHLAVAVGQSQDLLITRVTAAYDAIQVSDRRREEALTELSQMRYSGWAVGLAGIGLAAYLSWSQWDQVVVAYGSPAGMLFGLLVVSSLALPIVGGTLLSRTEDVDY